MTVGNLLRYIASRFKTAKSPLSLCLGSHMHLVFVYGTLKKGRGNAHLLADSKFISEGYTRGTLIRVFGGLIPGMLPGTNKIHGEVYSVTDETLARLDILEGVKYGLYERREIDVFTPGRIKCFAYFFMRPGTG